MKHARRPGLNAPAPRTDARGAMALRPGRLLHRALDAWALGLGVFAVLGFAAALRPGREAFHWLWIDGAPLPGALVDALVLAFGLARVCPAARARGPARALALALAGVAALDAARVWSLAARADGPELGLPFPASALLALLLLGVSACGPAPWPRGGFRGLLRPGAAVALSLLAVLAHVLFTGQAAAHPARGDAVVVLGARVHADGRPSGALLDRTRTACALSRAGPWRPLVLSGGRGADAPRSEPEAMRAVCRAEGLPAERLWLDEEGLTTRHTARSVRRLAERHGWKSVLVVSHDYHLARLHVAFREVGLVAHTVPCRETHPWPLKPLAVLREVAAFLAYLVG